MKGLISWFVRNGIVANLLMTFLVVSGLLTLPQLALEIFPEVSIDVVNISARYPGASPVEVEQAVCVRIEEAVHGLEGIERVVSTARESLGVVTIEIGTGSDLGRRLDEIKTVVEGIDTFPAEVDKPVVQELTNRTRVINVSIAAETDDLTLRRMAETVRDELLRTPPITQIEIRNAPPYEISIEVSDAALRRRGISFDFVADAIRRSSLDLPGGSLKSDEGEILLRTQGQAQSTREFERLVLLSQANGTRLELGSVASIEDRLESSTQRTYMDGKPAMLLKVFRTGNESAIDVADAVHAYITRKNVSLPRGVTLTAWSDSSQILKSRINLLVRNAFSGLILVFAVLALFLRMRLAFWVTAGVPISFLSGIALMPFLGVSINMISLFSFILVLGVVVDDAIVVAESIANETDPAISDEDASIRGALAVATPVIFGVLTTVVAFAPLLFLDGYMGKLWRVVPCIVIPILLFSLLESQLILPSHLLHAGRGEAARRRRFRPFQTATDWANASMSWLAERIYEPSLRFALRLRYLVLAAALATLLLTAQAVRGGYVKFVFFPDVESNNIAADLTLLQETPALRTTAAIRQVEAAALEALEELGRAEGKQIYRHVLTIVGEQPFAAQADRNVGDSRATFGNDNEAEVVIELIPSEERTTSASQVERLWRQRVPKIPDAVKLAFVSDLLGNGGEIEVQFAGTDFDELRRVAARTKEWLSAAPGVIDVSDSFRGGKPEFKLNVTPRGQSLGVSLRDLAHQVRQGFYGEEVQRLQRGRDEVRVMLRYPEAGRTSLGDLKGMWVRTPGGADVPFNTAAVASIDRGFASIRRIDRQRTISVTAGVDATTTTANRVVGSLEENLLPGLLAEHPGVTYSLEGEQRSQRETLETLSRGLLLALLAIYALLAIPFRSYWQPLIVMSAVPFGIVGAIIGHIVLGLDLSVFSLCGMVALSGVVVNDSLVLVSFINDESASIGSIRDAAVRAGSVRFRAVWLTSLTTSAGLLPLIMERAVQAQFLIPMAISLAVGVLFATVVTLVLVPTIYLVMEDVAGLLRRPSLAVADDQLG